MAFRYISSLVMQLIGPIMAICGYRCGNGGGDVHMS